VDSRTVKPGELFVAIRGRNFDGADFVEAALSAGAAAAITDRPGQPGRPLIEVESGLKALGDLARNIRRTRGFKVLAITGSVGKTTIKEALKNIIAAKNRAVDPGREILATKGNQNNEVGLPLTILSCLSFKVLPAEAVLEMGASSPGDIRYLTEIARPDVGLIGAIGSAHIEFFKDLETVARTKAELFRSLCPGAMAVANKGDKILMAALKDREANRLFYGPGGHIWLKKVESRGLDGQILTFGGSELENLTVDLPLPGEHNAFNALAAAAGAVAFGLGRSEIKQGLSETRPMAGRLKPIKAQGGYYVLDDSYNANPDSVAMGLKFLATLDGPKGAILGEMLELGSFSQASHREAGRLAADLGLDFLALVGDSAPFALAGARGGGNKRLRAAAFETPMDAAEWVNGLMSDGRGAVLIKGSRAGGLERAVKALVEP
jgi:UDP-N-acetylmuramoyl-tripeptide--D-alanyl-D-alanine ligase